MSKIVWVKGNQQNIENYKSLYEYLTGENHMDAKACAGKGICGQCKVKILKNIPLPTREDRIYFSTEQLRQGYRLACKVSGNRDMEVEIPGVTKELQVLFSDSAMKQHDIWEKDLVVLTDIGTTTVAMELRESHSGEVLAQFAALNPQRRFGADVMSRIEASKEHLQELQQDLDYVINQGINYFKQAIGERACNMTCMYVAGNTTMMHFFMKYPVASLGKFPFQPVSLDAQLIIDRFVKHMKTFVLPGISAFVGADLVADIYRIGGPSLQFSRSPQLIVDLGTNCEMILLYKGHCYATATAAGPAFEGGADAGVYGADMIARIAFLLEQGIVDETGLLAEPYFENGIVVEQVSITNVHIRSLQLAKAAVAAGIKILLKKADVLEDEQVEIYLAGGFGHFLKVEQACKIGLFPARFINGVKPVKNMVLDGLYEYHKSINEIKTDVINAEMQDFLRGVEVINLAKEPDFEQMYLENMNYGSF